MMDLGTDESGHSLHMLVAQALRTYEVKPLATFLDDGDAIVRGEAARQLQLRGGPWVLRHALGLLENKRSQQREIGAFILGQLGTPRRPFAKQSIQALLALLEVERKAEVTATALYSLGWLRAFRATNGLLKYKSHKRPIVRAALAFQIGMAHSRKRPPSRRALHALTELKEDRSRSVRESVDLAEELINLR